MTSTDPLMAMLRQLAHAKTAPRGSAQASTIAKDPKDPKARVEDGRGRADQFREQLRAFAQVPKKEVVRPEGHADAELAQAAEPLQEQATVRPRERSRQAAAEPSPHRVAGEAKPSLPEWRLPEAALSAVMSRLDHAEAFDLPDDGDAARAAPSPAHGERRAELLAHAESAKSTKTEATSTQGFASSLSAAETRATPIVKVAVREQETHFQPIAQPTLLQKIVDRIAPDMAAAPASAASGASDPAQALAMPHRGPDAPIRMLTLQLDPPDLGTVTVRMRLTGDAVEVKLSAERQDTTQLLRAERGALVDAMQSAGYTFEIAAIDHSHAGQMDPGAGQSQAQTNQNHSQQPQGGSQFSGGTPERQPNDAQGGTRHNRHGHDQAVEPTKQRQDEDAMARRSGDGVYL